MFKDGDWVEEKDDFFKNYLSRNKENLDKEDFYGVFSIDPDTFKQTFTLSIKNELLTDPGNASRKSVLCTSFSKDDVIKVMNLIADLESNKMNGRKIKIKKNRSDNCDIIKQWVIDENRYHFITKSDKKSNR